MKKVLTALIAVSLTAASTAMAENNAETAPTDHEVLSTVTNTDTTETRHTTGAPRDTRKPAFEAAYAAPAPTAPRAELRLPSIASMIGQDDAARNDWRNSLDAARSKRMRGIYLTLGGLIGGPLVGGTIGVASGASEGGVAASTLISMAGAGVGVWDIYQWVTAQGEIGRLEREGDRAGYVSVTPVRGGAAATLALSF